LHGIAANPIGAACYALIMNEAEAMLRLVNSSPEQDGPRLIYADWLAERGDPRGEFIRIQCELARLPAADARRTELQVRADALLKIHQNEWARGLKGQVSGYRFYRGFVETIFIDALSFLQSAERIFREAPIRHVHLLDVDVHVGAIARSPLLERLTGLTIFASHAGDQVARAVASSERVRNLRELNLGRNRIGDDGVAALVQSATLANLTNLDLSENNLAEAAAFSLASTGNLASLSSLNLDHNFIGTSGAHALLTTDRLPSLHALRFGHNRITQFLPLEDTRVLRRLRMLNLAGNGLDGAGIAPLVESPHLIGLQSLDLSHNALGDAGAEVLARSRSLSGLRTLLLSDNRITDAGVRLLASSPTLAGLTTLKLTNNLIGDAGIQALIDSPFLQRLSRLVSAES
jgi:uncharacterized protein (TIGR02996 family)